VKMAGFPAQPTEKVMSDTENGQSTGVVGTVINELHQFEQKVDTFLHPSASDNSPSGTQPVVGNADAVGAAASSGSAATANDASAPGADAGNVAAASGAIAGAPDAASPSALTGLSSDQSGAATNGVSADPNVGGASALGESLAGSPNADTGLTPFPITGDAAAATTGDRTSTNLSKQGGDIALTSAATSGTSELSNVAIDAGTAVLAAAEESASVAADALLARWHREMSLLGRGLSAETEKLIRDTAGYLGL
jgi:hypothetical protein